MIFWVPCVGMLFSVVLARTTAGVQQLQGRVSTTTFTSVAVHTDSLRAMDRSSPPRTRSVLDRVTAAASNAASVALVAQPVAREAPAARQKAAKK